MSEQAATTTTADTSASNQSATQQGQSTTALQSLGATQQAAAPTQSGSTPATPATKFTELLTEDGSKFADGWTSKLPDHLKPFEGTLKRYPSPMDLMGALGNANQALSKRAELKPPAPDATPEQQAEYMTKLRQFTGAPETPDGYGFKKPDNLPEGMEWNDGLAKEYAKIAHEEGLSPKAAARLLELYNGHITKTYTDTAAQHEQQAKAALAELRKDWGDKAEENQRYALKGFLAAGYTEQDMANPALANDAKLIKHMAKIGRSMAEDSSFVPGARESMGYEAQRKRIETSDAYLGKLGPEKQQAAVEELRLLFHSQRR